MKPDITGPGENILSTFTLYGGGWLELDGTSMATPYVSPDVLPVSSKPY
jgi:subtilisin family serine protease